MANSPARSGDDGNSGAADVDSLEAFEECLAGEGPVLVDFYADWCGPCQMMASTVDELADESAATVVKLDVEAVPEVAAKYDVTSIPAFVLFEDDEPTDRLVGMQEKAALRSAIDG